MDSHHHPKKIGIISPSPKQAPKGEVLMRTITQAVEDAGYAVELRYSFPVSTFWDGVIYWGRFFTDVDEHRIRQMPSLSIQGEPAPGEMGHCLVEDGAYELELLSAHLKRYKPASVGLVRNGEDVDSDALAAFASAVGGEIQYMPKPEDFTAELLEGVRVLVCEDDDLTVKTALCLEHMGVRIPDDVALYGLRTTELLVGMAGVSTMGLVVEDVAHQVVDLIATEGIFDTPQEENTSKRHILCPRIAERLTGCGGIEQGIEREGGDCDEAGYRSFLRGRVALDTYFSGILREAEEMSALHKRTADTLKNEIRRRKESEMNLRKVHEELEKLTLTDPLTGLYNHRHFISSLNAEFARSHRHDTEFSMLMLDLDHFKKVNDTYGHSMGDAVLIACAEYLQQRLRDTDIPCRYGGEEFALLLPGTDAQGAQELADSIRENVAEMEFVSEVGTFSVTTSIGVASRKGDHPAAGKDLIAFADRALYSSKNNGRNQTTLFSDLS